MKNVTVVKKRKERRRKEGLVERDERDARELAEEWREREEEESGRRGKGKGKSVELRRSEQPEVVVIVLPPTESTDSVGQYSGAH
ncbi:MAG: hypothetical protein O7C56_04735 [Rickettsia endosymbiont of Ixodes persulcatus]|nr:hypothetical protein [Rickettsia endosymbiont of Ixodes persulcatus]